MHGVCNTTSGACACDGGWEGAGCERESHSCSDHGVYNASLDGPSKCKCDSGWVGAACSQPCPSSSGAACGARGTCALVAGAPTCTCDRLYYGDACEKRQCPGNPACGGAARGTCEQVSAGSARCACTAGWIA